VLVMVWNHLDHPRHPNRPSLAFQHFLARMSYGLFVPDLPFSVSFTFPQSSARRVDHSRLVYSSAQIRFWRALGGSMSESPPFPPFLIRNKNRPTYGRRRKLSFLVQICMGIMLAAAILGIGAAIALRSLFAI
jgi:hypothetical protein